MNVKSGIKNIIFDLGGVVINLNRMRAVRALQRLGLSDADVMLGEYEQKGPFLSLETGETTSSELYDTLVPQCVPFTSATDIRDAFEEFLEDIPLERLRTIRALREKGYKLYVVSNTNPIMYNHWIDEAFRQEGKSINDYFDGIVVSFQERVCKPDPRIFRNLLDRYSLEPKSTVLLDDSEANCNSARDLGMSAIVIKSKGKGSFESVCKELLGNDVLPEPGSGEEN